MGLLVFGVLCAGVAGAGWTNRFSAVFTDYADGDRWRTGRRPPRTGEGARRSLVCGYERCPVAEAVAGSGSTSGRVVSGRSVTTTSSSGIMLRSHVSVSPVPVKTGGSSA